MKKYKLITVILFLTVTLGGCGVMKNTHDIVLLYGKTSWTDDNITIHAPENYFTNVFEWVDVDEHTKKLVITMSDNKSFGER